jgi:hypothetical protein
VEKGFVGGLLGHWAVWTKKSVELFHRVKQELRLKNADLRELLALNVSVTDMNAAIFDPSHGFRGSIAGIHEVLRRQGLMEGTWCLNPEEKLSEGQAAEIDRIYKYYPGLTDDAFAREFV